MKVGLESTLKERLRSWKDYLCHMILYNVAVTITAFVLMVAMGGDWIDMARIWMATSMNIFAIPILLWAWNFVWWVNYAIIIEWIGLWGFHSLAKRLWITRVPE